MSPSLTPFAPIPVLFVEAADSTLQEFLAEVHALVGGAPALLTRVDADLDAHGCRKKSLRHADAKWLADQTAQLAGVPCAPVEVGSKEVRLGVGRPRTPAFVVLVALLLRGFFGAGFKSRDPDMMLHESITLRVFLGNHGYVMPARSTLTELCNVVSNATRSAVLDAQVAQALRMGFDDFSWMLQDSTHVEGNSAWPTDSGLLVALLARIVRVGHALPRLGLREITSTAVAKKLAAITELDRVIGLSAGSREGARHRRRRYNTLLRHARRALEVLRPAVAEVAEQLGGLEVRPSRRLQAERAVERLRGDVDAFATVIDNCEARVLHEQKVPMAQKKLSTSDPDVGFIAKGQRTPVVGYKPQLARSGAGFIVGLRLPKGNAADSDQLVPMADDVIARTGVVPEVVSVDDGYASKANVHALRQRGVRVVSINGSKGKALTSAADWNSDDYAHARDGRSAIESLMYSLKQGFDFGEVARRGLAAAHAELLEKALAFNLCHMTRVRAERATRAGADADSTRPIAA